MFWWMNIVGGSTQFIEAFRTTDTLWEESTGHRWFLAQRTKNAKLWCVNLKNLDDDDMIVLMTIWCRRYYVEDDDDDDVMITMLMLMMVMIIFRDILMYRNVVRDYIDIGACQACNLLFEYNSGLSWRAFKSWHNSTTMVEIQRNDEPPIKCSMTWWHHHMETIFALLALCEGNPSVANGFH